MFDIFKGWREKTGSSGRSALSREKLKSLEELQKVDLQIRDLNAEAQKHPARLKQIETERGQAKTALDGVRGKLADNERSRRQNEQIQQLEKDKEKKWESRLTELKTPREYAALARELDILKKTNLTAGEEIKRLTNEYVELKKQVETAESGLGEKETVATREGEQIKTMLDGIAGKLQTLEGERAKLVKDVDPGLVARYERIRKQRGGVAVVPVILGTCKGCQRKIPPQMANNLITAQEIMTCPNCFRFIYSAPESETAAEA
jgi:predicted  nucleic acid-binding Zn-ribbon protein